MCGSCVSGQVSRAAACVPAAGRASGQPQGGASSEGRSAGVCRPPDEQARLTGPALGEGWEGVRVSLSPVVSPVRQLS